MIEPRSEARPQGTRPRSVSQEPEYKPSPEEQHELNMKAIERFRAGRRARGVVEEPPKKVPRIRFD